MATPTILVVDDDPMFRPALVLALKVHGYQVIEAESPDQAREVLENNLIHLLIADVRLKAEREEDRSGLQLCRETDPLIARIVITAFPEDWTIVYDALKPTDSRHRTADGFISKTMGLDALLPEIKRVVEQVLDDEFEVIPKRRIAVLTSGGDAPGMNAAIWAVVRTAMDNDVEVIGIQDGYRGLVDDDMYKLKWDDVSDIIVQGGTILGTARFEEFKNPVIRKEAVNNIVRKQITGLVVIGGDGSMNGASALADDLKTWGRTLHTVAIPGTIDNDLWGTDLSLGATSAAHAIVDQLRNMIRPAQALRRIFVVEVMGRYCGYLALQAALGIGADAVILPEKTIEVSPDYLLGNGAWKEHILVEETQRNLETKLEEIAVLMEAAFKRGKRHGFVIVAEGLRKLAEDINRGQRTAKAIDWSGDFVQRHLEAQINRWSYNSRPDVRTQVLGYPVRGGAPSPFDIWLGARLGAAAVQRLINGDTGVMVGWSERKDEVLATLFAEVVEKSKLSPKQMWGERSKWQQILELQEALSCPPSLQIRLRSMNNSFVQ